jgi:energy-coupling factor transporter ATP-binding protein EcfA2
MSGFVSAVVSLESVRNPFPGLRPFQIAEAHLFHGRREQVSELLQRMAKCRFLAVVGTSGSGKSSLVRAGVLPALYRGYMGTAGSRWRIAVMRPGGMPLRAMAQALGGPDALRLTGAAWNEMAAVETLGQNSLGLADLARRHLIGDPDNLLLIVDQFEEIFRFRRERNLIDGGEQAKAFVNLLLAATEQTEVPVYVVLTMRSDFLGDCAQFPALPEALNQNQYLVPRMTRAQRRQSIEGPLEFAGVPFTQRLVQRILSDAGDNPENLPVMQHALMRTFEEWRRDGSATSLDIEHYDRTGRIEGALHQHAEKLWSSLSTEQRAWAARVFRCLTTSESGRSLRRPAQLDRILRIVGASSESMQAQVKSVLDTFEAPDCSFLTIDRTAEIGDSSVIDIAHESLIAHWKRLDAWVKEESESADWYKRLVRAAELHARGQAGLWSDPDLLWAWTRRNTDGWNQDWSGQYGPGYPQAIAFLEESKRAREVQERAEKERSELELSNARRQAEAERRAKRNYLLLAIALAGLLGTVTWLAIQAQTQKIEARIQQKRAEGLAVQSDILTKRATEAERRAQAALKDLEAASALGAEADTLRKEANDARVQADASAKLAATLEKSQSSLSDQTSQTIEIQNRQIATLRAQLSAAQKSLPAAPVARLTAEPDVIPRGAAASLRWQVTGQTGDDASSVTIDQGIGAVRKTNSRAVSPGASTTYTLKATGPGGTAAASVTVTVDATRKRPPAQPPAPDVVVLREWQIYILRGPGFDGRALLFVTGLPSADGRANLFVVAARPGGAPLPSQLRNGDPVPQEMRALAVSESSPNKGDPAPNYLVHAFPLTLKSRVVQAVPDGMTFEYNSARYEIKVTGKNRIGQLTDGAITVVLYPAAAHQ